MSAAFEKFTKTKGGNTSALVKKHGEPIATIQVNDIYKVAIFKGSISDLDIIVKYMQKQQNGEWSKVRTPKHIHWVVDLLIKLNMEPQKTKEFLSLLIDLWNKTGGFRDENERNNFSLEQLLLDCSKEVKKFKSLNNKGEYSIKFLMLVATLLIKQEKSNRADAYMFKNVLDALLEGKDIFKIVSTATHNSRR